MGTQEEEQSLLKDDEFQFGQVEHPLRLIHSYWDASFSWCLFSTVKANPNCSKVARAPWLSKQFLSHHVVGQHSSVSPVSVSLSCSLLSSDDHLLVLYAGDSKIIRSIPEFTLYFTPESTHCLLHQTELFSLWIIQQLIDA